MTAMGDTGEMCLSSTISSVILLQVDEKGTK